MVFGPLAFLSSPTPPNPSPRPAAPKRRGDHATTVAELLDDNNGTPGLRGGLSDRVTVSQGQQLPKHQNNMSSEEGKLEGRPPLLHSMLAGGIGGTCGDMLMHSLDTVKTRQQGDPHIPPRYTSLTSSYFQILRQEGVRKGLYGGWLPALLGSFPGTIIFFGTYEYSKRLMLDHGVQQHVSYLASGFLGDLAASFIYVPSEVLKTRLQLQGRHNNPFFTSGYNYRTLGDAVRTMIQHEGMISLFHGYKATLFRDLPFSALQFMFYEQGQTWARQWKGNREIGWQMELLTGGVAGGLAGTITCPLDVVKTRLQTQLHPRARGFNPEGVVKKTKLTAETHITPATEGVSPPQPPPRRAISTSSPSTHTPRPGAIVLETSSITQGLKLIYQTEGLAGWFRGVGPRAVWTSIQSGCMLFLYQSLLRQLDVYMPIERPELNR